MSVAALVWLAVGIATTLILGLVLVSLVRQGILVGRTIGRLARDLEGAGVSGPSASDDAERRAPRR